MFDTNALKQILLSNEGYIQQLSELMPREDVVLPEKPLKKVVVFYGVRRSGKTYLLYDIFKKNQDRSLYIDFEDERLRGFRVEDFQKLRDAYFDLKPHLVGKEVFFLLDEVQNVEHWERFVRRLTERENIKVYVSGSSSKITPRELHTALRGRAWGIEVLPFSFREYLRSQNIHIPSSWGEADKARHTIKHQFNTYLKWGGFPEVCCTTQEIQRQKILKEYLEALFFKDLVERFQISNIPLIDALREKLFESAALKFSLTAFRKQYKDLFSFSKDSLYKYHKYFLESLITFEVKLFSPSAYKRTRNPSKVYLVDPGIARKTASEDLGRLLENVVFLEAKRRGYEAFYFENQKECDFILRDAAGLLRPVQVTLELSLINKSREIAGLIEACQAVHAKHGLLLTLDEEEMIMVGNTQIQIFPAWKWLLSTQVLV